MYKRIYMLLVALVSCLAVSAQTDMTSRITNPSFEQDTESWTQKGMSVQGNSVFNIKSGSKYMERWTGRGGAVYDLSGRQLKNSKAGEPGKLQPGFYIISGKKVVVK